MIKNVMVGVEYLLSKLFSRMHLRSIKDSNIDKTSVVYWGCNIYNTSVERYSYICHDSQIVNCDIGPFCSISDHVFIGGVEHPMEWVSTSPVFQRVKHSGPTKRFALYDLPVVKRTVIGCDVWIGHGATIKQGVKIGHGAVVGSNAVVTKDVPPYAIVGGAPAKVLKYRFDNDTILALLKSEWWNMEDDKIAANAHLFKDPKRFLDQINESM